MEVTVIRAFIEVARCRNFTAAAQNLHMTQSTLSRQIADLEREMGTALFVRGRRGVDLSEAGEVFLSAGTDMLARYDKLKEDLSSMGTGSSGTLTIGMPVNIFCYFPELKDFNLAQAYPDAEFRYRIYEVEELPNALIHGLIDLAVNYRFAMEPFSEEFSTRHFLDQSFAFFVRKDHELVSFDRITADDLADRALALLRYDLRYQPPAARKILARINSSGTGGVTYCANYESLFMTVSLGDEIGVMPALMVDRNEDFYGLRKITIEDVDTAVPLWLAQRRNDTNPLIRSFCQYCIRIGLLN